MGLLDNNNVKTTPKTGLEGSGFNMVVSNEFVDMWEWDRKTTGRQLRMTFRDIYAWSNNTSLFIVKGKITDSPTTILVNDTNFPNLRKTKSNTWPKIIHVIGCPCTFAYGYDETTYGNIVDLKQSKVRICVLFDNGQIYHNFPSCSDTYDFWSGTYQTQDLDTLVDDLFLKFDESVVWDLPGRKHPVKTTAGDDATLIATGMYYYNPALPDNCYEFHPAIGQSNGYGNTVGFQATNSVNNISSGADIGTRARFWFTDRDKIQCNPMSFTSGHVTDTLFTMIGGSQTNSDSSPCRICVFGTQDGGRNWYAMYEFAGKDGMKVGNEELPAMAGAGIQLHLDATAGSGLYSVKKRTLIVPNENSKDPSTFFDYEEAIDVQSINGTEDGIVITTSSAHGFSNGDCVIFNFKNGVNYNSRDFDWLVNGSEDGTSGGNGVMFKVTSVQSTSFIITQYIWNTNVNLPARHIHALNRCKDGVSVSTGEEYPRGGWIMYDAIRRADAFAGYNVALNTQTQNNWVRLNSTKDSFFRTLGCIVQREGKQTYCYIGVDHETIPMDDVTMPEGRTQAFKHNSVGLWKVPLEGIDDQCENGLLMYQARQTCFGIKTIENAFVFIGQYGDFAISYDNCQTWCEAQAPVGNWGYDFVNFNGTTYDRKFSINNILVQLKK